MKNQYKYCKPPQAQQHHQPAVAQLGQSSTVLMMTALSAAGSSAGNDTHCGVGGGDTSSGAESVDM